MMRRLWFAALYLFIAVGLEFAVLDLFNAAGGAWTAIFDWRLLSLAGIAWGLAGGEVAGMAMAFAAAFCYGLPQSAGKLGASLASFTLTAWLAGVLHERMRPQSNATRFFWMYVLLLLERVVWSLIRAALGLGAAFDLPWIGLAATALIGVVFLRPPRR